MSKMSMLSLSATENVTNNLIFFFSWLSKFAKMFEILSATVFLVRLILAKICRFSEHTISAAFRMHVFTNSPSEYGFDANALSLAVR